MSSIRRAREKESACMEAGTYGREPSKRRNSQWKDEREPNAGENSPAVFRQFVSRLSSIRQLALANGGRAYFALNSAFSELARPFIAPNVGHLPVKYAKV